MAELMLLHEVRQYALETPKPEKHMIWVERHKAKTLEYLPIYCVSGGFGEREALEIDVEGTSETISLPFSTYKQSWRCWTDRPSDEQMSSTGWRHEYGRKTEQQKEHMREINRKWRAENPEYMREYMRAYQKTEKSREYMRAYSKTEKYREYRRAYSKTEKYREYQREYRKRHKEAVKPDEPDRG